MNKKTKNTDVNAVKKKKRAWIQFVRPTALLLTSVVLLTYVTFAWMRREWTPYIEQEGIKIATGGSLLFEFMDQDGQFTGTDIKTLLKLDKDMVLRPVSNITGTEGNFFTLDMMGGEGNEKYKYLDVRNYDNDGMKMGIENGYIEFELMLVAPDGEETDRWVYIDPSSKIAFSKTNDTDKVSDDAARCIRISISTNQGQSWIFASDEAFAAAASEKADSDFQGVYSDVHTGINPVTVGGVYAADGLPYYSNYSTGEERTTLSNGDPLVIQQTEETGILHSLHEFDGRDENDNFSAEHALFKLAGGQTNSNVILTVRIWAEGTSKYCDKDISSAAIDLLLKFSSFTVDNTK